MGRAQKQLIELREHWAKHGVSNSLIPLFPKDPQKPGRDWLPEPKWISGGDAFEILRLQNEPYEYASPIARICQIIADQWDREEAGLNYALATLPPSHDLLQDFPIGSVHWFRALYSFLKLEGAEEIDGWEGLVSDLYEWIAMYDCLRIRTRYVLENALTLDWAWHEISLPEAKQEPIWTFPKALAWIATRDYLALARMGYFRANTTRRLWVGCTPQSPTRSAIAVRCAISDWLHLSIAPVSLSLGRNWCASGVACRQTHRNLCSISKRAGYL
jgi:hypothetical protein